MTDKPTGGIKVGSAAVPGRREMLEQLITERLEEIDRIKEAITAHCRRLGQEKNPSTYVLKSEMGLMEQHLGRVERLEGEVQALTQAKGFL